MRVWKLFLVLSSCAALVACGDKKSTDQLADEMLTQVETLPVIMKTVTDSPTLENAEAAASKITALRGSLREINQQVKKEKFLTAEKRADVEKRLRAVRGETEFLLQKLAGEPDLMLKLTDPLAELGSELELSRRLMKKSAQK